jgi:hypothetical protein
MTQAPNVVIFTDLDDTLFQTARKLPPALREGARHAATALNGAHSLMTPAQGALLAWMQAGLTIPVTARGSEAFGRVTLDFSGPAVVANGAVILGPDGAPDLDWQGRVRAALAPDLPALLGLPEAMRALAQDRGMQIRTWVVEEPGLGGAYAVAKAEPGTPEARLADLVAPVEAHLAGLGAAGWTTHRNGNNLALIPPAVSKRAATAHLLARYRAAGPVLSIGVGDSVSDLGFMRLCDLWMTPAGSQIDRGMGLDPASASSPAHGLSQGAA